jgi:hypothetical protein
MDTFSSSARLTAAASATPAAPAAPATSRWNGRSKHQTSLSHLADLTPRPCPTLLLHPRTLSLALTRSTPSMKTPSRMMTAVSDDDAGHLPAGRPVRPNAGVSPSHFSAYMLLATRTAEPQSHRATEPQSRRVTAVSPSYRMRSEFHARELNSLLEKRGFAACTSIPADGLPSA